jgi:aminoglycoside 3-N-acetyltransferase
LAYENGVIKEELIGNCKCMFFNIWDVVGLYQKELKNNPYKLYGIEE